MREIMVTLVKIAIVMILLTIFLFLFVDCKMENEKLKLTNFLLNEQVTELSAEQNITRDVYSRAFLGLLDDGRISWEDLPVLLPEREINYLRIQQGELLIDPKRSQHKKGNRKE